jgi:glycosyltransferase involved in cell wall biosynthesis
MIKVVFYFENEWAFGAVHNELNKRLFKYGISGQILHWGKQYTRQEIQELDKHIDFWVTNPHGAQNGLLSYGIDSRRIALVIHHPREIGELASLELKNEFLGIAAIESSMHTQLITNGFSDSYYLPVRISLDQYRRSTTMPHKLTTIGFAGASKGRHDPTIKRFYLVENAMKQYPLQFRVADTYHNSWISNQSFYSQVDAVIVASTTEGCCMPLMEAGAAGSLVLTTPVGCYQELITTKGADVLGMEDEDFSNTLRERLDFYLANPKDFKERCEEIYEHAATYDWEFELHRWVETFIYWAVKR